MNILMLCYEFPPLGGGGSRVVAGLAPELVRQGHEVDLVTMGFRGLPREELVNGVRVHRVLCWRRRAHLCTLPEAFSYLLAALPVVLRLARRRRFDINHTHFILPDGVLAYAVRRLTGLPYVITAHGSDVPGYNPNRLKLAHRLLAPVWRLVVGRAGAVVCPSGSLQDLVRRQALEVPTSRIPNAIDPARFHTNKTRGDRILVVTRLFERKGVQYVLEALGRLSTAYETHVVGDGPYLPFLRARADQLGLSVRFWGWLDNRSPDLKRLYESARIFVFPSAVENFPIVLLEAMAAGLAIVTTAGTGCAEVVGETGLLVPSRDAQALADALERVTGDRALCRQLGEAARQRLEARFTWPAVARAYTALYASHAQIDAP